MNLNAEKTENDLMDLYELTKLLPKDIDGGIIESAAARQYFTGFASDSGYLIVSKNGNVFLTDSRYIEAAQNQIDCCDVVLMTDAKVQIPKYLKKFNCSSVAIEANHVTVSGLREYSKMFKPDEIKAVFDSRFDKYIRYLRCTKKAEEIKYIKAAQAIAQAAYDNAVRYIKPGMTEKEVALALDFHMLRNGAEKVSFDTIVVSGKNSSLPHGVPSDKRIEFGDFVTMDFGAVVNGYHSDMTRTVAIGEASDEMAEIYSVVLEAQMAAIEKAAQGVMSKDLDAAARKVISDAGYGQFFGHSTGHGVGVEVHEDPHVTPRSEYVLRAGNIITVEPGIYIPDKFGVRIEDMLLITADGCENLTSTPKELMVINN